MNPLAIALGEGVVTIIVKEWMAWIEKRNRPAGYKYTEADIKEFLAEIDHDTPEAIKEEVKKSLGL